MQQLKTTQVNLPQNHYTMWSLQSLIVLLTWQATMSQLDTQHPNIVIIMADDMGFDDVSFRGASQFLTPNIDALAYSGVILKNLYVPAMCTPSRAALLTGKYPINTGMQHYVIPNDQPWGLPTNETTMAQIFQQQGYYTSIIGKWHLGMSRRAYTPTLRGFDHHYGYLGAYIDYWDHTLYTEHNYSRGHDFRNDLRVTRDRTGTYATDLFTDEAINVIRRQKAKAQPLLLLLNHLAPHTGNDDKPLQAPKSEIEKFAYIQSEDRRKYAAMVSELDKSVGLVISALSDENMLNNTIILFYSDNGAPTVGMHSNTGSNYPLRGQKDSPWEGAIRSSAAIWSPLLEKLGTVWNQRIYVGDLLPTLASAVGITLPEGLKLDGLNLWSALRYGYESLEREIVHNIDDYYAYAKGKWKFVQGTTLDGQYDNWLGTRSTSEVDPRAANYEAIIRNTSVWQQLSSYHTNISDVNIMKLRQEAEVVCRVSNETDTRCNPLIESCLFDIDDDPCEQNNLYERHKGATFLLDMLERIKYFKEHARPPNNRPTDPNCDPKYYNYEWTWWEDSEKGSGASSLSANMWWKQIQLREVKTILEIPRNGRPEVERSYELSRLGQSTS